MKTQVIEAFFRDGVFHPAQPVDLEQDAHVRLTVGDFKQADMEEDPEPTKVCTGADLMQFYGTIKDWGEDALEFQHRMRAEWDRGL